ncbi:MAG: guanylate kinase [Candidatus Omnitrophica bacterium]|nr:guanylate kinase [Candidatus Omnitrophota bacterium]
MQNITRNNAKKKRKGRIVIISGPSGSGKTTLHERLLSCKKMKKVLVKSISATTRPPRKGEKNGRDYFFLSEKMFLYKKHAGHFLESERVFLYYYGTPNKNVQDHLKSGRNVLLCIDVKGAKTVWRKHPRTLKIFIKAPSLDVIQKRMKKRATESDKDLALRLSTARKELKEAKKYDYVIVNDELSRAAKELETVILKELLLKNN